MKDIEEKIVCQNKVAYHNFFIDSTILCGIELTGTEIKSIRLGSVNIKDSYAIVRKGEIFVLGMHIADYPYGNIFNHEPFRNRKLLLHKSEITRLATQVARNGCTLVPLKVILVHGLAKLELGLARGKNLYDKRQSLKEKDMEMEKKKNKNYKEFND